MAEKTGLVGEDIDTLDLLYRDYKERLFRFVLPKVHGDTHVADDIVQDSFTAAVRSFTRFRARSSAYTWLCSIALHKIADHYRKQPPDRIEDVSLDLLADNLEHDDLYPSAIERWLDEQETRSVLQQAMADLPSLYREVLRFKYFDGLSVNEIGSALDRSPKAIEGLLARARRALATALSQTTHA